MGQHSLCITCSIWARRLDHYYNIQIDTHIGSIKLKAQVLRHTIFLRCMIFEILQVPKSTERANSGHVLQGRRVAKRKERGRHRNPIPTNGLYIATDESTKHQDLNLERDEKTFLPSIVLSKSSIVLNKVLSIEFKKLLVKPQLSPTLYHGDPLR